MIKVDYCYLCNNKEFDILLSQKTQNIKYIKLIYPHIDSLKRDWLCCKDCGLVSQTPKLEENEIEILYKNNRSSDFRNNETPEEYFDKITQLPNNESENYSRVQRFKKYIKNNHKNILDIGCGGGVFLYTFSKFYPNFKLYGVEASPQFSSLAKSKLDIKIYNSFFDGSEIKFKPDVITLLHVLEHIPNPNIFLKKLSNIMSNESLLIVEVPHVKDFNKLNKDHIRFSPPHIFYYSEHSLQKILLSNNFKIIDYEIYSSFRKRNSITAYIKKNN